MSNDKRSDLARRERIIDLLSDEEVAKVSTAETSVRLPDGEEYIDLEELGQGVRQAHGETTARGRLLPRSAVRDATWGRIVAEIGGGAGHP